MSAPTTGGGSAPHSDESGATAGASSGTKAAFEATVEKPRALAVKQDGICAELRECPQWVCWAYVLRISRWTKAPVNPRTGRRAKANNPATWGTFEEAVAFFHANLKTTDGIGFEFSPDDPYCGVDLDDAIDPATGGLKPWAAEIVRDIDTYTEVSPSRTGVKLYLRGKKPGDRCRTPHHDGEVEMYDQGRFFAMTGERWGGSPATIQPRQEPLDRLYERLFDGTEPRPNGRASAVPNAGAGATAFTDDEVVEICRRAKNRHKFDALMAGDTRLHGDDDSRADGGLCCLIAFVTKDAAQIERIFGRSKLAERDKWRDRADYRSRTISKALSLVTEQYQPPIPYKATRHQTANGRPSANGHAAGEQDADQSTAPRSRAGQGGESVALGALVLRPGAARRTAGGGVRVQVAALAGVDVVYDFVLTPSPSGWRQHAAMMEQLAEELPDRTAIFKAFAKIVAAGGRRADAPPESDGPTVESVVKAMAPARWHLVARTAKGSAWSESRGCEVSRSEFTGCVDDELMACAAEADDAPRDVTGRVSRIDLLRLVQAELQVQWATLVRTLPPLADVELGGATAAGRAFREAMVRLWTSATTWEIPKRADGQESERVGATRASLISRVTSQRRQWERVSRVPQSRERWRQVHPAASAWWRVDLVGGEVVTHLGMRWDVVATMRQELPGVTDQDSLLRLGRQYGVFSVTPAVPDRLSGGKSRLAVLTPDFAAELSSTPEEQDASDAAQDGCDEDADSQ